MGVWYCYFVVVLVICLVGLGLVILLWVLLIVLVFLRLVCVWGFDLLFVNVLLLWCSVMFCCGCSIYVGLVLGYLLLQIVSVVFGLVIYLLFADWVRILFSFVALVFAGFAVGLYVFVVAFGAVGCDCKFVCLPASGLTCVLGSGCVSV